MLVIQVLWSDGFIHNEWNSDKEYERAIQEARDHLQDPTFEGDYMRIITSDGELVWDSRNQ